LPQLQSCRKCPIKLGQIFLAYEEEFLNYSMYFKNIPQQTRLMEEGGIEFFSVVQRRLRDDFSLNSYLIKPFQRVTKYKIFLEVHRPNLNDNLNSVNWLLPPNEEHKLLTHKLLTICVLLFVQSMIKHSEKSDRKGKMKEYYDQLKEAQKMVDFILRHGNDLLAVECLAGFHGSIKEQGKILRQGDLTLLERTKHRRRVFLFENAIVFAKKKKVKHHHDVPGSEMFEFRSAYKVSENIFISRQD